MSLPSFIGFFWPAIREQTICQVKSETGAGIKKESQYTSCSLQIKHLETSETSGLA